MKRQNGRDHPGSNGIPIVSQASPTNIALEVKVGHRRPFVLFGLIAEGKPIAYTFDPAVARNIAAALVEHATKAEACAPVAQRQEAP